MINKINSFLKLVIIVFLMVCILMRPQTIYKSVMLGLDMCYNKLIPSLFPFLIVSSLFMQSPLTSYGGLLFKSYSHMLGIKNQKAATVMLLSYIGGFAVCGMLVSRLYKEGAISQKQASLMLCCTASVSPAFAVSAVGYGMLKSSAAGWLIYLSLLCSSLLCGLILKPFFKDDNNIVKHTLETQQSVAQAIQGAINAMLSLCGFVIAFCFINAAIVPQNAPHFVKFIMSVIFEVTSGCQSALLVNANKIYLCCTAMSLLGICAMLQMQGFCGKDISLLPFLLSRLLHLPVSLVILRILLIYVPISVSASAQYIPAYRLPADTLVAFFLLLIAFFFDFSAIYGLRKKKYKV